MLAGCLPPCRLMLSYSAMKDAFACREDMPLLISPDAAAVFRLFSRYFFCFIRQALSRFQFFDMIVDYIADAAPDV